MPEWLDRAMASIVGPPEQSAYDSSAYPRKSPAEVADRGAFWTTVGGRYPSQQQLLEAQQDFLDRYRELREEALRDWMDPDYYRRAIRPKAEVQVGEAQLDPKVEVQVGEAQLDPRYDVQIGDIQYDR